MRVRVAVTLFTGAKDYALPQFCEMLRECVCPSAEVRFYGDRQPPDGPWGWTPMGSVGSYAEDMLIVSRGQAWWDARMLEVDVLVLQGVDAWWESRIDFERVVGFAAEGNVVAPLISARNELKPIARYFHRVASHPLSPPPGGYSEDQHDWPVGQLSEPGVMKCGGFPGADNIAFSREVIAKFDFAADHVPWYQRVAEGRVNLCVEEYLCLRLVRAGVPIWLDRDVKVWHVHEDFVGRRLFDEERDASGFWWAEGKINTKEPRP